MSADLIALIARGMIAASIGILLVLAIRGPARAMFGARTAYAFWLLVPGAVVASYLPARIITMNAPEVQTAPIGIVLADVPVNALETPPEVFGLADLAAGALFVWLAGVVFSLLLVLLDQRRVVTRWRLRRDGPIYRASVNQAGPAVVGVLSPRVVVPADFEQRYDARERDLVLAHERAHISAGDVQINALATLALCINWFNPIFYLARRALRIDQELACDERVVSRIANVRRTYAEAMLKTQLATTALPIGCYMPALGMNGLKQRIDMLRRPAISPRTRAAGAIACATATFVLGFAAWAAQPPRVAIAQTTPIAQRDDQVIGDAMGRQLVTSLQDGDIRRARALVVNGADVNYVLRGDGTPLIAAVRLGDADFIQALLRNGADVNLDAPGDGNALIVAANRGDMTLIPLLVSAGGDINGYVPGDETPLIAAARENRLEAARYLLEHGADANLEVDAPTIRGMERRSPMSVARRAGHSAMIDLLRRHGANN